MAMLAPAGVQAEAGHWTVGGTLSRNCAISFDCGGGDRCNSLRLADRNSNQDIAQIRVSCNFAGSGVSLELSSQNNGTLVATSDPLPLGYDIGLTGIAGAEFDGRQLSTPIRVPVRIAQPAAIAQGSLHVRLYPRREILAADRYSDRITITVLPDPS